MYINIQKTYTKSNKRNKKPYIPWASGPLAIQIVNSCKESYRKVYEVIRNGFNIHKEVTYSEPTIAASVGLSERHVRRILKYFESQGILRWKQRYMNSNVYFLNPTFFLVFIPLVHLYSISRENVRLKENTKYLNSSSSLLSLKKSLSSLLTNSNQEQLSTNRRQLGDSWILTKEQKMRMLLKEAQRHVNLTEADIELLDTLPDAAIAKALKKLKTKSGITNKAAYFMKIAQYESGSITQDRSHFTSMSDNGHDVNPYVNNKLPLQSGYKPTQNSYDKTPLKREVRQEFKQVARRSVYDTPQSTLEQLKADLDEALNTISKVFENKQKLLSEGANVSFCDAVIQLAQKRALFINNELKKITEVCV